jgi:hypothetical protein
MNHRNSRYDPTLEVLVEPSSDPDMARLRLLRWLAERELLEHRPVGAPSGDFAARLAVADGHVDVRAAACAAPAVNSLGGSCCLTGGDRGRGIARVRD